MTESKQCNFVEMETLLRYLKDLVKKEPTPDSDKYAKFTIWSEDCKNAQASINELTKGTNSERKSEADVNRKIEDWLTDEERKKEISLFQGTYV